MSIHREKSKKIETVIKNVQELRKNLDDLDLLMEYPKGFPKTVYCSETEKDIAFRVHNIVGWILGILYNERGKINEKLRRLELR
jgi:hypothetical protein